MDDLVAVSKTQDHLDLVGLFAEDARQVIVA